MSFGTAFAPILIYEGDNPNSPTWWRLVWGKFLPSGNEAPGYAILAGDEDQPGGAIPADGGGHWEWDPNLTYDGKNIWWFGDGANQQGYAYGYGPVASDAESGMWVWVPDDWSYTPEGNGHWQWNNSTEQYDWVPDNPQP